MLWEDDGSLGEVSRRRLNVLLLGSSALREVLITALNKSQSPEGDFLLSSHGHPRH